MPHSDPESPGGEGQVEPAPSTEQRLADVIAAYRALQAENEAYRERVSRNAERRFAQRHERLLLKFIDILDNLDRALDASELSSTGGAMIEGLILVRTQLLQTLQEEGLERTPVVGIPYDPEVAEAVGTQPVDDPDHHHVVMKDIRRGYRLNGRLARAAQVIVGEYQGELPDRDPEVGELTDEDSGRVEVVGHGSEDTGEMAALAAEAAAAIEAGRSGAGPEPSAEEPDDDDFAADLDLEAAAREAAAMAEADDSDEGDLLPRDDDEISAEAAEGLLDDEDSLEQAAREAAALVGEDELELEIEADPETGDALGAPPASSAEPGSAATGPGRKPPGKPSHPLDDVDPSAFEDSDAEENGEK